MARHGEGEPRLPLVRVVYADHDERARVEHADQRREPRLVVVLRAVVAENGVGEVTLQKVCRPALPILQKLAEALHLPGVRVAAQKLDRRGRRARARVEHRDADLAPRERLIEHRQVADDDCEEAEARACLDRREHAPQRVEREHVAVAEREECDAAQVEVRAEVRVSFGRLKARARGPLQEREGEYQRDGPHE